MRRIGFLISSQHFVKYGGIGQFAKGFAEFCVRQGYYLDIILDEQYKENPISNATLNSEFVNIFVPPEVRWSGLEHKHIHAFSDSIDFERVCRFRDATMQALAKNVYDAFIINTPEALFSSYSLNIADIIHNIFYTHNENLVFGDNKLSSLFVPTYDVMISNLMQSPSITIGTQTNRNLDELKSNSAKLLPYPIPEIRLLDDSNDHNKSGVLFIGRWEPRKNPEAYIDLIKKTGLPAKVMTNKTGAKKFKDALSAIGVDYDVRESIVGEEKVNFIKSSKIFFMPSLRESYGLALMECIGHTHSIVLDSVNWHDNFDSKFFHKSNSKNIVELVNMLYNQPVPAANLEYIRELHDGVDDHWNKELFLVYPPGTRKSEIVKHDKFFLEDFFKSLNRAHGICIDDVLTVYRSRHHFNIYQTKSGTYFSKEPVNFIPDKNQNALQNFWE